MEDHSTQHALTEVALALAMAFFAIMILAMVSMSTPAAVASATDVGQLKTDQSRQGQEHIKLASAEKASSSEQTADSAATPQSASPTTMTYLFYHQQTFYDQQLNPVDVSSINRGAPVVLALPPSMTMVQAMAIRQQLQHEDLVITQLDQPWLRRLAAL